jgi:osmotically inducible protein OsmC
MSVRQAEAEWKGGLKDGEGSFKSGSGAISGKYSFPSRFEDGSGTNPEELIGAAHASCFSMAFAAGMGKAGFSPRRVHTVAKVHLEKVGEGFAITRIELETEAEVPDIDEAKFQELAEGAKKGCPISKALAGTEISLKARLAAKA